MKFDLNDTRRLAGLPAIVEEQLNEAEEKSDASPEHVAKEKELFNKCISCCNDIVAMCEGRLKEKDLTPEHKKQYTDLCKCTKEHIEALKKHLASY